MAKATTGKQMTSRDYVDKWLMKIPTYDLNRKFDVNQVCALIGTAYKAGQRNRRKAKRNP